MTVNDGRQKQFSLKQKFLYTPIGARWENDGQCIERASTMNECHLIFTKQAQLVASSKLSYPKIVLQYYVLRSTRGRSQITPKNFL